MKRSILVGCLLVAGIGALPEKAHAGWESSYWQVAGAIGFCGVTGNHAFAESYACNSWDAAENWHQFWGGASSCVNWSGGCWSCDNLYGSWEPNNGMWWGGSDSSWVGNDMGRSTWYMGPVWAVNGVCHTVAERGTYHATTPVVDGAHIAGGWVSLSAYGYCGAITPFNAGRFPCP